jgi:uncharacterized protein
MPNLDASTSAESIDYTQLAQFLLEPLLDQPQSLTIDCEKLAGGKQIWLRVAFEQEDKGKVFGRGGRNLRAIETVLRGAAADPEQRIRLDIYGNHDHSSGGRERSGNSSQSRRGDGRRNSGPRRSRTPKPSPQLREPSGE